VVEEDTLLRLRRVQIEVDGHEETAIACIWVTDGIDSCRVGFLKRHMLKHAWRFDGAVFSADPLHCNLAEQRMHYHSHGCALATIVSITNTTNTTNTTMEIDGKMPVKGEKRKAHEQGTRGGY
jgi:hypothetical protein